MLALLILWAYLDFMQLLIVWQSDFWPLKRPGICAARLAAGPSCAALAAAGHFFLPFFALLWPGVQRSRRAIIGHSRAAGRYRDSAARGGSVCRTATAAPVWWIS